MSNSLRLAALPTKELFIDMLTKDIPLSRAILDLVDNAVDGARKAKPQGNYKGYFIDITFDNTGFRIKDNCGGISIQDATEYAFRFGRPTNIVGVKHSVGQFGIGMKRALFKIGDDFSVRSCTSGSSFFLKVNVPEWKSRKDDWYFYPETSDTERHSKDLIGTDIQIRKLHESIQNDFASSDFRTRLISEIEAAHVDALSKGLTIRVGLDSLVPDKFVLRVSSKIKPAVLRKSQRVDGKHVIVKFFVGIADSSPSEAGWYVFCNGRMILEANKELITGWGQDGEVTMPRYHNQYSRFRGYVYFDSDFPSALPWNTTKTGVDSDSKLFKWARLQMLTLSAPVVKFLNVVKEERGDQDNEAILSDYIDSAKGTRLDQLSSRAHFLGPTLSTVKQSKSIQIRFSASFDDFERVRTRLRVTSVKDVGEGVFDYYLRKECKS